MQSAVTRPKHLLRQPGGFEGLLAVEEHLHPRQLSVAASLHIEDLEVHFDAAFSAPTSMVLFSLS